MGMTEILILVTLLFSSGGLLGLPLSVPPLPPDAVIERAAPDELPAPSEHCGHRVPDAGSANRTEQMLADPEMQEFLARVAEQVVAVTRQVAPLPPQASDAVITLVEASLARPMAVDLERFRPPSPQGPPELAASLVLRAGDREAAIRKAVAVVTEAVLADGPPGLAPRDAAVAGITWQRVQTPIGPLSWGLSDGSLIVTLGPGTLESLLARMGDAGGRLPPGRPRSQNGCRSTAAAR